MSQTKIDVCLVVFLCFLLMIRCNENRTGTEKNVSDATPVASGSDTSDMAAYNPAMDVYNMGGESIQKLGDTLGMKMYIVTIKPGDSAALHSHPDHIWYVIEGGKASISFNGGERQELDFKSGMGAIAGPLSDAGRNVGNTTVKLLVVDIYRPRPK